MVAFLEEPTTMLNDDESELMTKSEGGGPMIVMLTLALWEIVPLDPITGTMYEPLAVAAPAVMLRVETPEDDGVTERLGLVMNWAEIPAGVFGRERFTVPENPFKLETVMVEL